MKPPWKLEWRESERRRLRDLPPVLRREIVAAILLLQEDPYPPTSEPLDRELSYMRKIRVNGWRILYRVKEEDRKIIIRGVRRRDANTYLNL